MSEQEKHDQIMREIKDIKNTLQPIADTYATFIKLGTWAKWLLGFLLLCSSLLLTLREIIKR